MKKNYAKFFRNVATLLITFLQLCLLNIQSMAQADAGISSFTQPSSLLCPGTGDVTAVIHNYGVDTLTSVTINWSVNGIPQTTIVFTDTLASGVDDTITLGSYNFLAANTYNIEAYTANPNGVADVDNTNDTLSLNDIKVQLSGIYTVGGTAPDFARLPLAVTALNTYGVCGPVTINIRPMFDTIKVFLNEIVGASSTNTIVIQAENGDSSSVVLSQASVNTGMNDYLIRLYGADYITLCRLTMQRTGNNNLQHVIDFTNGATNNFVIFSHIIGGTPLATGTMGALINSSAFGATNDSSNTISNNLIEGGSYGIYMNGVSSVSLESSNTISNNMFLNQSARGIHLNFQRSPVLVNNQIAASTTNAAYNGIVLLRNQGDIMVAKNRVITDHGFGIYINNCVSSAINPGLILNNFISAGDSAGIRILSSSYQDVLNNSVLMKGTGLSALFVNGTGSGNIIENNILMNSGGGYAIYSNSFATSGILLSNYNDLVTTGANIGNYAGSQAALLSDWMLATGQDNNSVSIDPLFVSASDMHTTAQALDNLGLSLGYVPDDIDGEVRSATTPDIGADEFTGGTHDLGVIALLTPADSLCEDPLLVVSVLVSNNGTAPIGGFDVVTQVSGAVTATLSQAFAGTLQGGTTDTLTYSTTLNTTGGGTINFQSYTSYSFDDDHNNDTISATRVIIPRTSIPAILEDGTCGQGTVTLTAFSADSIFWYDAISGGNLVGTGSVFTTPVLTSTTIYFVSAKGLCESYRMPVVASIFPLPVVNLGNDTIANDSITLDAGSGMYSYLWSTTDTTQQITVNASNTYYVTVTDTNGCFSSDTVVVTILVGIPVYSFAEKIDLYPNPAKDFITVAISGLRSEDLDIRIVDMLGALVKNDRIAHAGQNLKWSYPVSDFAKGIYSLQIRTQKGNWNFKFVVN